MERITISHLVEACPTEAAAYLFMEKLRWPEKPVCPHCGSINDHYFLRPKTKLDGKDARRTRTGAPSERRVWKCKDCRRQFSVLTGTIFHGSKVPVRIWLFVIVEMVANKNGIAAREIERKYGVHPKTAWFMTHRIREAMSDRAPEMMVGTIVADETFIGGERGRMNHKTRARTPKDSKTPVVALINAETGEARVTAVANVSGATLRKVLRENVDIPESVLHTDESPNYIAVGREFKSHGTVTHKQDMYVNKLNGASTNKAENFFSQFKRSLDGTHHHVSREHLGRYANEFAFRYSTCKISDTERLMELMSRVPGRRLSYKRIVG
jgi:transposase-like protein